MNAEAMETKPENLPFPRKLHAMLQSESSNGLSPTRALEWDESGQAFRIVDEKVFQEKVLPKYFRTARLASFIRNLNIYGFRKGPPPIEFESGMKLKHFEQTKLWYIHPEFRRSGVEAIAKMSRTIGRLPLASGNREPRKKTKATGPRRTNGVGTVDKTGRCPR